MRHLNKIKNKKNLIIVFFLIMMLLVILTNQKKEYTIYVEKIDNFSPDRKLIVYENKKKIDFKEIQYEDGIVLCSGNNPTVSYSEVAGEKELIVKLNNKKQVIAKIKEK